MSARHVRAVQRLRREFPDRLDYEILCIIATDTGNDDSPARTSHRGIAQRAGCHYNTVSPHLRNLADNGWIRIEKRGKYEYYPLLIEAERPSGIVTSDCDNEAEIVTTGYDNQESLSQRLSQIEARLSQLEQLLSQIAPHIVTIAQRGTVTKVSEDSEEGKICEEARARARNDTHIYQHPDPLPISELKTALAAVVKEALGPGVNEEVFEAAAYILLGYEITPDQVDEFKGWWAKYGHYDGKPALKSLLSEIRNSIDGVTPRRRPNGRSPTGRTPTEQPEVKGGLY